MANGGRKKPTLGAVLLAAGQSKRFRGTSPKVLHPLGGRPVIVHVLDTLRTLSRTTKISSVVVVVPPGKAVEAALSGEKFPFTLHFAQQKTAGGTGEAAAIGLKKLPPTDEVMVLAGDAPLITPDTLEALVRSRRDSGAHGSMVTTILPEGGPYGRVIRDGDAIVGIVEVRDCTPEQAAIREVNMSFYAYDREALRSALPKLSADNAQKERYLTDVVGHLIATGGTIVGVEGDPDEVLGANTRGEFAVLARLHRERRVAELMENGVTVVDPSTTYVDSGVIVGADTVIHPNTFLEGRTKVGGGCDIGPMTQLIDTTVGDGTSITFAKAVGAKIGERCSVGPFASLRIGTVMRAGSKVGTFVETKNASIGEGSKVPHLSYMGDVVIGRDANVGAGTITSNYDGKDKHVTKIGDGAFTGSNTVLVAPVRVGKDAYTGAGSVVNRDVPAGGLVFGVPAKPRKRTKKPGGKGKKGA